MDGEGRGGARQHALGQLYDLRRGRGEGRGGPRLVRTRANAQPLGVVPQTCQGPESRMGGSSKDQCLSVLVFVFDARAQRNHPCSMGVAATATKESSTRPQPRGSSQRGRSHEETQNAASATTKTSCAECDLSHEEAHDAAAATWKRRTRPRPRETRVAQNVISARREEPSDCGHEVRGGALRNLRRRQRQLPDAAAEPWRLRCPGSSATAS